MNDSDYDVENDDDMMQTRIEEAEEEEEEEEEEEGEDSKATRARTPPTRAAVAVPPRVCPTESASCSVASPSLGQKL